MNPILCRRKVKSGKTPKRNCTRAGKRNKGKMMMKTVKKKRYLKFLSVGLAFVITNYFYGEKSVCDYVKRSAIYGRVLF